MVQVGTSELDIFPLQFGGNVLGWTADESESCAILDAIKAGGGNSIDSADVYGNGTSETILGRWMTLRGNRSEVVVATKVGLGKDPSGASRASILKGIDNSLARLQTDYVDLYYIHRDDPNTPLEETIAALTEVVAAGKVRYIGASNYSAARLAEALRIADETGGARFVALQPRYSLVERGDYEGDLAGVVQRTGVGVLSYSSLASGFLTGQYRDNGEAVSSPRAERAAKYLDERGRKVLAALDDIASSHATSTGAVALAWLRSRPGVVAPIASASKVDQVAALLEGGRLELNAEELGALTAASS
jgi:aryl-alcohol dehydrogenase-like predicted oxidoreductase